jgi:hypothetical protein
MGFWFSLFLAGEMRNEPASDGTNHGPDDGGEQKKRAETHIIGRVRGECRTHYEIEA